MPSPLPDLGGKRVLLLAGKTDPIAPPENVERLRDLLAGAGADVTLTWQDAGHDLTGGDIDVAMRISSPESA